MSTRAQALAQLLKNGKISKDEARTQLFAEAAAHATKSLWMRNKKLEEKVRKDGSADPHLIRLVDQILSKG